MLRDVSFGTDVMVAPFTNLYGCTIGDRTRVGPFVEIQAGAVIGSDCKIQSHSFICDGVTIEDEVFVGHGVVFVNDKFPRATTEAGELAAEGDWTLSPVARRSAPAP
jgi:UDP-2-acetamido-3-amino-2,3-dideoxy-glucuronate N-acetyltransferase